MTEKELMLISLLGCTRTDLYAREMKLSEGQEEELARMQERRKNGESLQYILGETEFMGLRLKVDRRVLIPRPETELLVDLILQEMECLSSSSGVRILDLGTGSGNIAISLAKHLSRCLVTAVDISADALALAQENAILHDVAERIEFVSDDMVDFLSDARERGATFDVIVSNPPYIRDSHMGELPHDVQQEPEMALNGGNDGLKFCRVIARGAQDLLKTDGKLVLEVGDGQRPDIEQIFRGCAEKFSLTWVKDYAGTDRIMIANFAKKCKDNAASVSRNFAFNT